MSHMQVGAFGKESRRQPKQSLPKGCCCKRSQCIKNYCDCYQSMVVCSMYCKCIDCRNTVERTAVSTTPKKTAMASRRERAAALSAKAAAAAAKAGINIHLKPAPGSAAFVGQQFDTSVGTRAAAAASMLKLPDMDVKNVITLPPLNAADLAKKPQAAMIVPSQTAPMPKDVNVFKPPIAVALLECLLEQAVEGEKLGLNEIQVGKLILHEFALGLQAITNVYNG